NPAAIVGDMVFKDGTLLVPSSNGNVYALDTSEGGLGDRVKWAFPTGDKVWSTPAVSDDSIVYFGSLDHNVYAVSLNKGQLIWKFPTGGSVVGQPLIANGMVYIGGFDSTLYALDAKTGNKRWEHKGNGWFWAGPATDGQSIFAGTLGGKLMALDPQTGRARWE